MSEPLETLYRHWLKAVDKWGHADSDNEAEADERHLFRCADAIAAAPVHDPDDARMKLEVVTSQLDLDETAAPRRCLASVQAWLVQQS